MSTLAETHEESGLCLLSFDAGGTRAISQLRILAHVMNRLNPGSSNPRDKHPCVVFDMIGGTGSGGFIALLLGLLGLNAEQTLSEFVDLNNKILNKLRLTPQVRTNELAIHIDDLLKRYGVRPNTRLLDQSPSPGSCKVVVPISYKHDAGSMCTLRNFHVHQEQTLNLTIKEALMITLATPPLFTPAGVSKDSAKFEYIGGELTLSNPVQEIISEACGAFDLERRVACLVSLGCGHPGVISAPDDANLANWNRFLEHLATGNERTAQVIDRQMGHLGIYFRFCVPTGLEKAPQRPQPTEEEIIAHTSTYLEDRSVLQKVDTCVDFLIVRDGVSSLEQLKYSGGERILPPSLPPVTQTFIMRKEPWEFIEKALIGPRNSFDIERSRMVVVTGMAGCGKTQIILKFMREYQDRFASQFFIDSSSKARLRADIVRNVRALGTEHSQKTFEDCLLFLAETSSEGPRLIMYDNVDDPDLELASLLPRGKSCVILITSRDRLMGGLCPEGHLELDVMSVREAIDLLLHDASNPTSTSEEDRENARSLARELGCLPLALQQARSYMFQANCSISTYLQLLNTNRDKLLSMPLKHRLDTQSASTYAAFDASFDRLTSQTQQFLQLLSFFHWSNFPLSLVALAARHSFIEYERKYVEHGAEFRAGKALLERIFLRNGQWDSTFIDMMANSLQNYSLAIIVPGIDTLLIQMHPLTHAWSRACVEDEDQPRYQAAAVLLLTLGARHHPTPSGRYLASHVTQMAGIWRDLHVNDAEAFSLILSDGGLFEGALSLREQVVAQLRSIVDPHGVTFTDALWVLALTYSNLGRFTEAEVLQAEVITLRKRLLDEGDVTTLDASISLANTYRNLRRFEEAEALQAEVLRLRTRGLGRRHPDTIAVINSLALTLSDSGRLEEAEKLQVEGLGLSIELQGEHHPDTISASGGLANTYLNLGRLREALPLQQKVVQLTKEIRGERHPETSKSMSQLALIQSAMGNFTEAEAIQEEVHRLSKELRGERHPLTISACSSLGKTYYELSLFEKAVGLQDQVLRFRKELLGERHLDTITASGHLAATYFRVGRSKEAIWLQEEVWRKRKDALGEGHPDTLAAATTLAHTYRNFDMAQDADKLLLDVMNTTASTRGTDHPDYIAAWNEWAIVRPDEYNIHLRTLAWRREHLGEKHLDTIESLYKVSLYYGGLGRLWRAEKLLKEVILLREETLGEHHPQTLEAYISLALIYVSSSRPRKAEPLQRKVVNTLKETRGERHFETINASIGLAYIYYKMGRYQEAEVMERETLKIEKEALGWQSYALMPSRIQASGWHKFKLNVYKVLVAGVFSIERYLVDS
ncbi:hypothetical protein M408DRAFT_30808 [Serendipita vermifera MAFF 305830]|uniref:PNPLA domain-containing protein n=1 Tax=Serendipita vermifera MAFF 305830 TaxID=933852 RepID=A0A0C2W058_SERVB|nr:hypothetical protein M408DRAFT_30808 [Serendipita vermifera MAFF 305830]